MFQIEQKIDIFAMYICQRKNVYIVVLITVIWSVIFLAIYLLFFYYNALLFVSLIWINCYKLISIFIFCPLENSSGPSSSSTLQDLPPTQASPPFFCLLTIFLHGFIPIFCSPQHYLSIYLLIFFLSPFHALTYALYSLPFSL